jgi:hypothetical protein
VRRIAGDENENAMVREAAREVLNRLNQPRNLD